jgi:hypothetical protein
MQSRNFIVVLFEALLKAIHFIFHLRSEIIEWRNLRQYRKAVRKFANSKANYTLPNSSSKHATIIMCNIFRTAENYICIFAGTLAGVVSNEDWRRELRNFLEKENTRLDVILESRPEGEFSQPIKDIIEAKKKYSNRISISYATNDEVIRNLFGDGIKRHFTFADGRMFRLEIDTENYIASASFNQPEMVENLKRKFESIPSEPFTIDDEVLEEA